MRKGAGGRVLLTVGGCCGCCGPAAAWGPPPPCARHGVGVRGWHRRRRRLASIACACGMRPTRLVPSASEKTCAGIAAFLHPPTAVLLPLSRLLRDDWLNDIKGTRVRRHNVCEYVGILPNHRHDLVAAVVFPPVYVLQQLPIGGLFAVKAIIGVAFAVADLCPSEQLSQMAKELRA